VRTLTADNTTDSNSLLSLSSHSPGSCHAPCPHTQTGFSTSGLKQEEIVNMGIQELLLNAFVRPSASRLPASDDEAGRAGEASSDASRVKRARV
jgi:hypothetical protein